MRLLIDTDFFCKLGVSGLLDSLLTVLAVERGDCRRLPALPHMLRRGRLHKLYGDEACGVLRPFADSIEVAPNPSATWLDLMAPATGIDPGEAHLFGVAAEEKTVLLATGDKRALRVAAAIPPLAAALSGRVIAFEAALILLVDTLGEVEVRRAVSALATEQIVRVCFSPTNLSATEGLRSYLASLQAEVQPIVLWQPPAR